MYVVEVESDDFADAGAGVVRDQGLVLPFTKGLPRLLADTAARRRDYYPMAELSERTLLVVGLGAIGAEVTRLAKAYGCA